MKETKLKLCPYCGGRPALNTEQTFSAGAASVFCPDCKASTLEFTPYESAMNAWNIGFIFSHAPMNLLFSKTVIVTRHAGTVEWLKKNGIEGKVIDHVHDSEEIEYKIVIGALPLFYASQALAVASIDMPDLPADRRGQELTPAEMDAYGARLSVYRVTRG